MKRFKLCGTGKYFYFEKKCIQRKPLRPWRRADFSIIQKNLQRELLKK